MTARENEAKVMEDPTTKGAPPVRGRIADWAVGGPVGGALGNAADFVVGTAILIGVWALVAGAFNPLLFPGPKLVATRALEMMRGGEVWLDLLASLTRIAVGYGAGVVLGTGLGLLIGEIKLLDRLFTPIVSSLRMLPAVALVPLAIIWFGIGEVSKYFIIMYATAVVLLFSAMDGVHRTPQIRIRAARCMGASRTRAVFDVVIPSAIPYIWTGMKIGVGLSFASVVAAELIAANTGIGALIMNARTLIQTDRMFVGLALLAIVGGIADRIYTLGMERLIRRYIDYARG